MERPRTALGTRTTTSTSYADLVALKISSDAKGISYFSLSIDPDPKALYRIVIGGILSVADEEITAIWSLTLPHLAGGFYQGIKAGDGILVQHRSTDGTTVKTGLTLALNEVV